jgi:hypothetical protein
MSLNAFLRHAKLVRSLLRVPAGFLWGMHNIAIHLRDFVTCECSQITASHSPFHRTS